MNFEILILGPVELRRNGRREMYGSAKDAQMLAALALDVGRAVPLDTLVRHLWDDTPPGKPRSSLHSYAARLRRKLGAERLIHQAHAYTLDLDPDTVDHYRHERLTAQARSLAASGDDTQALTLLRQASVLWRGEPLTGMPGLWAERIRRTLEERRLAGALLRVEIGLRMGHFADLAGELSALLVRYPADEAVVRHFMTAAYGSGRQTDALRAYDSVRRLLREEGTEPGEALSRTYRGILDRTPVDDLLSGRPPGTTAPPPNNLPAYGELIGRTEQLRALRSPSSGVIALQSISGMAGVGKSLLALHTAGRLAGRYPDGQLHIDLHGHSPGRRPLTPEVALATLLRHFGVPASAIPQELTDLTALWRTMLSTRRAVIILDDASDADQVAPVLLGTSASLVLITSRRRLSGLPGVRHIFLDILSTDEAVDLFTNLVGPERVTDRQEVAVLADLCDHLPLALELAAGRLNSRPTWTVSHLVRRMTQVPGPLAELRDGGTEISSAFALSYNTLPTDQRRAFRLLGLHPGSDFGAHSTAALIGLPLETTERILESLQDSHLIREPSPERFSQHDLIAEYALTLTLSQDSRPVRETALDRLSDFYLQAASAADQALNTLRPRLDPPPPRSPFTPPTWPDARQAKKWLTAEHTALTATVRHARSHGRLGQAARFAHVLAEFLDSEGYWEEAEEAHSYAADHWRSEGNSEWEAQALINLAAVQSQRGRYPEAEASGQRALRTARAVGDSGAEADALRVLGLLCWNLGRLDESLALQEAALAGAHKSDDSIRIARCNNNLGIAVLHLGDPAAAMKLFREALSLFTRKKSERGEAQALNNLAEGYLRMGEQESARSAFSRSLDIFRRVGSRSEQATAQLNKANVLPIPEELENALNLQREALSIFREIGDRRTEAVTLNAIGKTLHQAGQHLEASAHHATALHIAQTIGAAQEKTEAHRGLGMAELRSGRHSSASEHLRAALSWARRTHATADAAHAHAGLAELALASGRAADALPHLTEALAAYEELNKFESDRVRAQMTQLRQTHDLRE
ncbi:tetratricopeptide repeat protein [Streptomyces sp. NPDC059943]|uniref:AfsR/SARP family transcriptional regulator n=1 Tax=Streptomyces sp. NPDC059943 TaxID=3347010 RepID=UPI0036616B26